MSAGNNLFAALCSLHGKGKAPSGREKPAPSGAASHRAQKSAPESASGKGSHRSLENFFRIAGGIFLLVSLVALVFLGFNVRSQDLRETESLAEETVSYLENECRKFDNYTAGISANSLQKLLDTADALKTFAGPDSMDSSDFLHDFIRTVHVSGIIVTDSRLSVLAQTDMDDTDNNNPWSLWKDILSRPTVTDILKYPHKTYIDQVTLDNQPYDYAVVATDDGSRLILCYTLQKKPGTDPYEFTIGSILENNNFHKNPVMVITDGTKVLSTNSEVLKNLGTGDYRELSSSIVWKENALTSFHYQGNEWYGLRRLCGNYFVYAVYPAAEVFSNRSNVIVAGFMLYLTLCLIILTVQRHFDKANLRRMGKQLRIINAISTSYSSTFLLHIDRMELEAIRPSARLEAIFNAHPSPYEFLFAVCRNEVDPEYYPSVMNFLELDTMAARLKGETSLSREVRDRNGVWFSLQLIPQRFDPEGNVLAVLVTTRNITSIKQVEDLSFRDKLTGLHNRNYMESRSKNFVRTGDYPVSLIMADCNYLKQTNDTLGHEYGDLLLQRVASVIRGAIDGSGIAMRIGGDEFLILCPHCSAERAGWMIANMKQQLAEKSDEKLTLSVSFGSATITSDALSFEEAFQLADQAMYQEKEAFHASSPR